jgi:hypothetical protein
VYPDMAIRREIAFLEVFCPHKTTGCGWIGYLSSVEEHAAKCPCKNQEFESEDTQDISLQVKRCMRFL